MNIVGILDGAADGQQLDDGERAEVRAFRERLKRVEERVEVAGHVLLAVGVRLDDERHNARQDGAEST